MIYVLLVHICSIMYLMLKIGTTILQCKKLKHHKYKNYAVKLKYTLFDLLTLLQKLYVHFMACKPRVKDISWPRDRVNWPSLWYIYCDVSYIRANKIG